jgi:hypothetical protein
VHAHQEENGHKVLLDDAACIKLMEDIDNVVYFENPFIFSNTHPAQIELTLLKNILNNLLYIGNRRFVYITSVACFGHSLKEITVVDQDKFKANVATHPGGAQGEYEVCRAKEEGLSTTILYTGTSSTTASLFLAQYTYESTPAMESQAIVKVVNFSSCPPIVVCAKEVLNDLRSAVSEKSFWLINLFKSQATPISLLRINMDVSYSFLQE